MDKICKHCNLIWKNADHMHFCTSCGRPLETVNPGPEGYGSGYNGGQNTGYYDSRPTGEIPRDNVIESYKKFWRNYFDFNGRSRRSDYWQVILVNIIIAIILGAFSNIPWIGRLFWAISWIYSLAALIPGIALGVRRLHDIGKSGLYYLFILIPIVGPILLIVWFVTDSEPGPHNYYGQNPKWVYDNRSY